MPLRGKVWARGGGLWRVGANSARQGKMFWRLRGCGRRFLEEEELFSIFYGIWSKKISRGEKKKVLRRFLGYGVTIMKKISPHARQG